MERQEAVDTGAIVSLIAGIVGIMFALFSVHVGFAAVVGLLAVVSGVRVLKRVTAGGGLALTGIVLGTIAVAACALRGLAAAVF